MAASAILHYGAESGAAYGPGPGATLGEGGTDADGGGCCMTTIHPEKFNSNVNRAAKTVDVRAIRRVVPVALVPPFY